VHYKNANLSMSPLLLILSDKTPAPKWGAALSAQFEIFRAKQIPIGNKNIVIIDTLSLKENHDFFTPFNQLDFRCLIVGNHWADDEQVNALINGAAGYCDINAPEEIIIHALNSILKGEIWIPRHLVQRVIGELVKLNTQKQTSDSIFTTEDSKKLAKLSARELEVAKMIKAGEKNKKIAQHLNISERTVKAHLTSAFKKLEVKDRLQLALLMKEINS